MLHIRTANFCLIQTKYKMGFNFGPFPTKFQLQDIIVGMEETATKEYADGLWICGNFKNSLRTTLRRSSSRRCHPAGRLGEHHSCDAEGGSLRSGSDTTTYCKLLKDPTPTQESKSSYREITSKLYNRLRPSGSQPTQNSQGIRPS